MLVELSIKHFAIIDEITIPFEKGLTVLTGETGAGKSIIIDAIGLLIGGRGSADYVRYGEKRAEIEGLFIVEHTHPLIEKAKELGIDTTDCMFILRREITAQGKSICRINGKLVTISILREIGQSLVDIHGQHEHQMLLQPENHISLLDSYCGEELERALSEYETLYKKAMQLKQKLRQLSEDEQMMAQKLDLLKFQLNEIENANLEVDEDERMAQERHILAHSEKLFTLLQRSYESLYGDHSGLDYIMNAMNHLEEAAAIDEKLKKTLESVQNCYYMLEEAAFTIRDRLEMIEFDPERLQVVENRLHEINQLKRKYGNTVNDILEYAATIEEELDTIIHKDDHITKLKEQLHAVWQDLLVEAELLTNIRRNASEKLTKAIKEELNSLYMEKAQFSVEISRRETTKDDPTIDNEVIPFGEKGIDDVEFFMSANVGEPLKPLAKIASGGEISRMMLALKTIFSNEQEVTSVIFDEIDTGVGGRVAQAIAEKISAIADGSQVLCISHLPQVAAMADTHLYISKQEVDGRVTTNVKTLSFDEKVEEIARMMSGVEMTEITKEHARELLRLAQEKRGYRMTI